MLETRSLSTAMERYSPYGTPSMRLSAAVVSSYSANATEPSSRDILYIAPLVMGT